MLHNRLLANLVTSAGLFMVPALAAAHPLTIVNNTDTPLSFSVNYTCSEEIGTINEVSVKSISEETLNRLCLGYTQPCTITAYYGGQCLNKPIGGMRYNSEHNFEVSADPNTNISIAAKEDTLIYSSVIRHK